MIRVYSANFTKEDYQAIGTILSGGLGKLASHSHCETVGACHNCKYIRVCKAVMKAIDYCEQQAEQMVES